MSKTASKSVGTIFDVKTRSVLQGSKVFIAASDFLYEITRYTHVVWLPILIFCQIFRGILPEYLLNI
jgi:hypothetical protein